MGHDQKGNALCTGFLELHGVFGGVYSKIEHWLIDANTSRLITKRLLRIYVFFFTECDGVQLAACPIAMLLVIPTWQP